MPARIELLLGDIFEGPSDLIVIPCSTAPTVTWFVKERLDRFHISEPHSRMAPGEVVFQRLDLASQVAPQAAFAASVRGNHSRPEWLTAIAESIGRHARQNGNVELVACPLLGTGAGGLSPVVAFAALTDGFLRTAPPSATLRLFAINSETYQVLDRFTRQESPSGPDNRSRVAKSSVRVFVSYSHTNAAHVERVKGLATMLRGNGIEARLDRWHLSPGMDMAQWMSNELDLADRVLVVCDELYAQKSDRRHGGVGWEVRIVQGDLYASQAENPDKYIPIIATEDPDKGLPAFLRAAYSLRWPVSTEGAAAFEEDLVRTLYRSREAAPPLGRRPSFLME